MDNFLPTSPSVSVLLTGSLGQLAIKYLLFLETRHPYCGPLLHRLLIELAQRPGDYDMAGLNGGKIFPSPTAPRVKERLIQNLLSRAYAWLTHFYEAAPGFPIQQRRLLATIRQRSRAKWPSAARDVGHFYMTRFVLPLMEAPDCLALATPADPKPISIVASLLRRLYARQAFAVEDPFFHCNGFFRCHSTLNSFLEWTVQDEATPFRPEALPADSTPLHGAAQTGDLVGVEGLLTNTDQINARDQAGFTPLHLACSEKQTEVALRLLREPSVQVNIPNSQGTTPIHYAVRDWGETLWQQQELILSAFKGDGVDLNRQNHILETPLHHATMRGNLHTVRWLLINGANPNLKSRRHLKSPGPDILPIHYAIMKQNLEMVSVLLRHGAEVDQYCSELNGTPAQLIKQTWPDFVWE